LRQGLEKVFLSRDQAGGTALWDTLAAESKAFAAPRNGAAIFVFTDGDDNASRLTQNASEREMVERGVRVFSFSLIAPIRASQLDYRWFTDFARYTGGFGVNAEGLPNAVDDKGNLNGMGKWELRSEIAQMFGFYRVQIELPERPRAGASWNLKLAPGRKHLVIEWPRELAACRGEETAAVQ